MLQAFCSLRASPGSLNVTATALAAARSWTVARPFSASAADVAPPPTPMPSDEEGAATLPPEQLAKALLAGNVRGQLTTITAGEPGADESKVTSSIASYVSPKGEAPVVLLSREDGEHLKNMGEDAKASLATGHISPAWFIQRLRATGWLPRRVALLGSLHPLPPAEVRFAVGQARKAAAAAAPSLAAVLPSEEQLAELQGFQLADISQAVYVDAAGRQHQVAPADLDSTLLDPLALCQHDLLAQLNQELRWREQLQLFCAAYLGVAASDVLLTQADRLGFTVFGKPAEGLGAAAAAAAAQQQQAEQAQQGQRWRQFRIGSSRELRNKAAFLELLEQMREEVKAVAGAH